MTKQKHLQTMGRTWVDANRLVHADITELFNEKDDVDLDLLKRVLWSLQSTT